MNKVVNDTLPVVATPATLLQMAVEQGADMDKLEKLMALQERWEKNQAEKAFNQAMSDFSSNLPTIEKTVYVEHFDGYHADIGLMAKMVREAMAPHGLSFRWNTDQGDKITVTCIVKHRDGHSESTPLSSSPDKSGGKNDIQAIGSAVKYLERYTLEAATGIVASGADDDGQGTSKTVETITDEQLLLLEVLIGDHYEPAGAEVLKKWVFSTMKISALVEIRADRFDWLIKEIDKAIASRDKT
jgi:hypothetical protein